MDPIHRLDPRQKATARQIHQLFQAAYACEAALLEVRDCPPLRRTLADIQTSDNGFWGLCRGDVLAGVIELESVQASTVIASLAVEPRFHRQGIGLGLVQFVLDQAREPIRVSTAVANTPAVALYTRLGFVTTGQQATPEGINLVHLAWPTQ